MMQLDFKKARPGIGIVALMVWFVAVSVPLTFMMAGHTLPLPTLPGSQSASSSNSTPANGRWQAVHILVAGCPCSGSVVKYLIERGARKELNEQVWLVGGTAAEWESGLVKSGFLVEHHDAEQVALQLGIQGGPWLRLISPTGAVAYSGGYSPQRPGRSTDICDLALWHAAARGETVKPYPAFGCAASSWLRRTIDPMGIKYALGN